ncbi:Arm DNA-binding domain-containing protein [Malikia sp.]|uniref:Arm DNA-binding domain-containing protein n=1 Tax=Malikia sp. TaxID=2070706 RepID=UPI00345D5789
MLTEAHCKNATCPPDKARARLADSGGLYLEVSPNGSRRWFWKYRKDGKEGRLALGALSSHHPQGGTAGARRGQGQEDGRRRPGTGPAG